MRRWGSALALLVAGIVLAAVWPGRADLLARIAGGVAAVSAGAGAITGASACRAASAARCSERAPASRSCT